MLLALPLLLTLQKLVELVVRGERSHQLFADRSNITGFDPREYFSPVYFYTGRGLISLCRI